MNLLLAFVLALIALTIAEEQVEKRCKPNGLFCPMPGRRDIVDAKLEEQIRSIEEDIKSIEEDIEKRCKPNGLFCPMKGRMIIDNRNAEIAVCNPNAFLCPLPGRRAIIDAKIEEKIKSIEENINSIEEDIEKRCKPNGLFCPMKGRDMRGREIVEVKRQNPRCKDYPSSGGVGPERCRKAYGQTWTFKPWPTKQCCPPGDMRGREIVEVKRQNPRCKDYPSSGGVGPERCRKAYGQTWTLKPWPTKQCCPPGDMRGREIVEDEK